MGHYDGYRVTSPYGERISPISKVKEKHTGIDLAKAHQGDIFSFTDGIVTHAEFAQKGTGLGGFGNTVCIVDSNGYLHLYGHLDSCTVQLNDKVKKGQLIGKQGNTGQSAGSHLHYEIRSQSKPSFGWRTDVNPTEYLDKFFSQPAPKVSKEKIDWKEEGLKFLQEEYGIDKKWKATDEIDFGTLGAILSKKKG
jgi:murein DD-endopeptidase MepM/ murein hydrolase activator NlpD